MGSGRRNRWLPVLCLAVLLTAAACSQPVGTSVFLSAEQARTEGGTYTFSADFDDSTLNYATTLAARMVTSRTDGKQIELDIRITPPDGEPSFERVSFPLEAQPGVRYALGSGSLVDYAWTWRHFDMRTLPRGQWQFAVRPTDPALAEALRGIGFSYEKQN